MHTDPASVAFTKVLEDEKAVDVGLTKREYFAAVAMQGLLAESSLRQNIGKMAVDRADELIAALNGQK